LELGRASELAPAFGRMRCLATAWGLVFLCSLAMCSEDGAGSLGAAASLGAASPGIMDLPGVNTTLPEKGSDPVDEPVEEDEEPEEVDSEQPRPPFHAASPTSLLTVLPCLQNSPRSHSSYSRLLRRCSSKLALPRSVKTDALEVSRITLELHTYILTEDSLDIFATLLAVLKCKSFSWSERKQDCMTSSKALSFNGDFTFFSRRVYSGEAYSGENRMGNYRRFDGLMYQSQEFTRYEEKSEDECKKYCDTGKQSLICP